MKKALLLLAFLATSAHAETPVSELLSAALVAPFDATQGKRTYLTAHSPGAFSALSGVPAVATHWTFWSDTCQHLANFNICLTQDDSIVVDVTDMGAVAIDNTPLDSRFDLTGFRGMATVHAFQADERCRDPGDLGYQLVPDALWGTWSVANLQTNAAFGDRMQSLNIGEDGFIVVPDEMFEALDLSFFNPDSLSASQVVLVTVRENFGDLPGEVGPGQVVIGARAKACDVQEVCLSLPDVMFGCSLFSSLIPGPNSLIPETLMPGSSGFLRLSSPRFGDGSPIVGGDLWVYSWHVQQLAAFGVGARGTYANPFEAPSPTPTLPLATFTPPASPTPTLPFATPTGSNAPTPSVTPTVTPGATITPTPSPDGSPTPIASPTPSQAPSTPTPGGSPTPEPGVTPTPSPVSTPTSTPTSSPSPGVTPGPTPEPTPTTDVFGP